MEKSTNDAAAPATNKPEITEEVVVVPDIIESKNEKEQPAVTEKKTEPIPEPQPIRRELDTTLPFEDRILAFIESRGGGIVRLNDFLKSLYPLPKLNEPPVYFQQQEGKKMRVLLGTMQATGKITLSNDNYLNLGKVCQSEPREGNAQPTHTHNLNTVIIEARKK